MAKKGNSSSPSAKKSAAESAKAAQAQREKEIEEERLRQHKLFLEIASWVLIAVSLLLFISNFGIGGAVGGAVSTFLFGFFGFFAYLFPVGLLIGTIFAFANRGNRRAIAKLLEVVAVFWLLCVFACLLMHGDSAPAPAKEYAYAAGHKAGGGFFGALLCYPLCKGFGVVGAYIITIVLFIICLILLTGKFLMNSLTDGGRAAYQSMRETRETRSREIEALREEARAQKETKAADKPTVRQNERRLQKKGEAARRTDKKAVGVSSDVRIVPPADPAGSGAGTAHAASAAMKQSSPLLQNERGAYAADVLPKGDLVELHATLSTSPLPAEEKEEPFGAKEKPWQQNNETILAEEEAESGTKKKQNQQKEPQEEEAPLWEDDFWEETIRPIPHEKAQPSSEPSAASETPPDPDGAKSASPLGGMTADAVSSGIAASSGEGSAEESAKGAKEDAADQPYLLPPVSLLNEEKPKIGSGSAAEKRAVAEKLTDTLANFGVNVTVTDVSVGPTVTRYELQPESGVKVSRIVNLADDIKLNLAAADIRIEAPIPGKAAVGIEVPNEENVTVSFRGMMESKEFASAKSKLSFAVGRDIAGQATVADIAKMPHLLIAGATGSGKSVCINTIIMSILYKARPDEVKLLMIDPKVVELSIYNGIPHLLSPVVTDPKKAAETLNWAVNEMTNRYARFAECGARKIEEYNEKTAKALTEEGDKAPEKMPQIVIIVDELADLMMVASHEVEDAICRLAQLARAAGMHLVIATQRPSVNVITGLIKANMPSRIAFAVTSGVDSRTILDRNGAEKLLGKGDMLFYPQGAPMPMRVQGAFVSDEEVSRVVSFIKEQNTITYAESLSEPIFSGSGDPSGGEAAEKEEKWDAYFFEAAETIIDKERASIGMLQRYLKVGFNRAARIMDQLQEAGIVGGEEGTKPRKVLMSSEELHQFIDENR